MFLPFFGAQPTFPSEPVPFKRWNHTRARADGDTEEVLGCARQQTSDFNRSWSQENFQKVPHLGELSSLSCYQRLKKHFVLKFVAFCHLCLFNPLGLGRGPDLVSLNMTATFRAGIKFHHMRPLSHHPSQISSQLSCKGPPTQEEIIPTGL